MYDNIGDEKQLSFSSEILLNALKLPPTTQQLWITYSGGVDSHVLLHAIAQLHSQLSPIQLRAVHIHHGLNEQADDWATHCFKVCQQLNVPCDVLKVKIIKQTRQSLEALARQARYNAIKKIINDGDVALTAQHADDQAETLLLQLLRGAGAAGLSAMPQLASLGRGWLMRPLLNFTQADLLNYAEYHQLKWIEDSSNQNIHFDRNFLRHQVIPVLKNRWESMTPVLNRVAQHQAETTILLMELAQQDYVSCRGIQASQLHLPTLQLLSIARQRNLIRFWIKQSNLPTPTTVQLEHILVNVIAAQNDRQPVVKWQGGEVRRYQDHLYVLFNDGTIRAIDTKSGEERGVLQTNKRTPGRIRNSDWHASGLVSNESVLVATFNDQDIWAFCQEPCSFEDRE